jgi:hypothetical protein
MEPLLARVEGLSNIWLGDNTPLNARFSVSGISEHSGMINIVIDSPAQTLGALRPQGIEQGLQDFLEAEFPGVDFMILGGQRENTKSKLRRDPERNS